ncbi:hypothetical protein [Pandoraea captiosa]|nr:hypothetical protein [Pandoraea captiosa]
MNYLFRGVCDETDQINDAMLRPAGRLSHVLLTRGDSALLFKENKKGVPRDCSITRYPSETNSVRSQHIESGLNDNCFVSFSKSRDVAYRYATTNSDGERASGFIYVVDPARFEQYGVTAITVENPYFPGEMEVSLRASDCGDLPEGIIVRKIPVTPYE